MNVTLPEKNKINKRRIIIYSIAIFACILAIVVVIGIQILGNDVVDNFFGVSKITKKTEEEENRLKANFDTLFQNQLENNSSCEVKKIDKNKDIVYTNYENTDKSANNYEMNVNLPYINIKNQSVQDYNENIKKTFHRNHRCGRSLFYETHRSNTRLFHSPQDGSTGTDLRGIAVQ